MIEWFLWAKGVGLPVFLGVASLGAAIAARAYLAWYLPTLSNWIAYGLVILGAGLLGYAHGFDSASDAIKDQERVAQIEALQRVNERMERAVAQAGRIQMEMAASATQMQVAAQEQKGKADDLIEQIKAVPAPAGCDYTPVERQRVRSIQIHRPRPAAGADPRTR